MANKKRVLFIDFDDVIMKSKPAIERQLKLIDERASEEHLQNLTFLLHQGNQLDQESFKVLEREHYDYKDRVLEEVDNKYKGLIDYNSIITIENSYPNAIEYINYLCNCGYYDEIYVVSHHNVEREVVAKANFICKYLPKVKYIPVPFYEEKYEKGKARKMTNKALYVKEYLGLDDIINFTLIDDSSRNGLHWTDESGFFLHFMTNGVVNNDKNEISSLFPYDIIEKQTLPLLYSGEEKNKRK